MKNFSHTLQYQNNREPKELFNKLHCFFDKKCFSENSGRIRGIKVTVLDVLPPKKVFCHPRNNYFELFILPKIYPNLQVNRKEDESPFRTLQ